MKTETMLEFRCPDCECRKHTTGPKGTKHCEKCPAQWKKGEYWKCFAVIRQCVSKLDYDYYEGLR
jgi:ribosomal protein L37AE/L43A